MSWNGRDIVYQVSPGVRHRMLKELIEDALIMNDIYKEIKYSSAFEGKKVILSMSRDGYEKVPTRWRSKGKVERLFGVPVVVDENALWDYHIIPTM